jgi:ABC-type thiamin/hydroxymethylpyrimidine transport system permease subunit
VIPRPGKAILLELLLPKHEAVALPEKKLHMVSSTITEREEVRAEGIEFEFIFDQYRQTSRLLPEINHISTQVDSNFIGRPHHA